MRNIALVIIVIVILVANATILILYKHEKRPRRSDCARNLRLIILNMNEHPDQAWTLDRDSKDFPDKLVELSKETTTSDKKLEQLRKAFFCPFCRETKNPETYCYTGLKEPNDLIKPFEWREKWPILWDRPENHEDGVHVAYYRESDVHIEFITHEEFDKLHRKHKAALEKYSGPSLNQ